MRDGPGIDGTREQLLKEDEHTRVFSVVVDLCPVELTLAIVFPTAPSLKDLELEFKSL